MSTTRRAPELTPSDQSAKSSYPHPDSWQAADTLQRLRHRRPKLNVLPVYAAALIVLLFADPREASFLAGAFFVVIGLAVRIWAFGHLRKNWKLVTTGPYAHTRNPAYLGSGLILIGLFLAAGNAHSIDGLTLWGVGVLGLVLFFGLYLPRKLAREYRQLARFFPQEIQRHAAHVPNFFPQLTPWRSGDTDRFSWRCVSANNEWIWPVVCIAALAVMWLG